MRPNETHILGNHAERVAKARQLWEQFDTPISDNEELEEPFLHFPAGTDRMEVWHWFEEHFAISLYEDVMAPSH